jgi:glycosyltransferase involved in cell wall biosynthesis
VPLEILDPIGRDPAAFDACFDHIGLSLRPIARAIGGDGAGCRGAAVSPEPVAPGRTVVHLIAPARVGGAESVVRALASGRRDRGGATEVVALLDGPEPHPFVEGLRGLGVPVHVVRCGRRRYRAEARVVSELLHERGARIVHTHVYHADFVGYWAARACGTRVVATVHGFVGGDWKNRLYQSLDRLLLRRFDAVICVSDGVRTRLVGAGGDPARVRVISNGHPGGVTMPRGAARERLGIPDGTPTIGWVGRLSAEKGADLLLAALPHVGVAGAGAVLLGAGEEAGGLATQAASLGLPEGAVRLVGERADAASLLGAFDVLVISSRTEGLPMVLLEAMAVGTPVVAFAVGGIPDVLGDESGWLVPAGDVPALAGAIRHALSAPDEAARRAAAARRALEARFGLDHWLRRVEAVYATVDAP